MYITANNMDKNANMHRIVDVGWVRKLAPMDSKGRNIIKAGDFETGQLFDGDHDHGQSRCIRNFQQIFKLSVIKY